jgi:hypothetical protein
MRLILLPVLAGTVFAAACVRGSSACPGSGDPAAVGDRAVAGGAAALVGAWRLVSIVDSLPDGTTASWMGEHSQGLLVYDATGHVAAQVMNPARPRFAGHGATASDSAVRAAYDTYYAYFGRYTVFPDSQLVVHHIEGSLRPAEVGVHYRRPYELAGDRLRLRTRPQANGVRYHRWLTWERTR